MNHNPDNRDIRETADCSRRHTSCWKRLMNRSTMFTAHCDSSLSSDRSAVPTRPHLPAITAWLLQTPVGRSSCSPASGLSPSAGEKKVTRFRLLRRLRRFRPHSMKQTGSHHLICCDLQHLADVILLLGEGGVD